MKAKDVSEELIGKRCKCIFTGLMVTGTIEEIKVGEHTRTAGHSPACVMTSGHSATLK